MPCATWVLMLTSKTTSSSSCMVATILEGASCYDPVPHYFFFHHMPCYVISFTSPSAYHLLLTTYPSPLQTPFTKPRTVLLSICLCLSTFLPTHPYPLTNHLTFLPIPSSTYPRMYYT
jgi:hypothetical protein